MYDLAIYDLSLEYVAMTINIRPKMRMFDTGHQGTELVTISRDSGIGFGRESGQMAIRQTHGDFLRYLWIERNKPVLSRIWTKLMRHSEPCAETSFCLAGQRHLGPIIIFTD